VREQSGNCQNSCTGEKDIADLIDGNIADLVTRIPPKNVLNRTVAAAKDVET